MKTDIYFKMLQHIEIDDFLAACQNLLAKRTDRRFPLPADFLAALPKNSPDFAHRAWATLRRHIAAHGSDTKLAADDPVLARTIENMGGLRSIGARSESEISWTRREFLQTYQAFNEANRLPAIASPGLQPGHIGFSQN
ncbi:MAG: DUF6475 domain-containing protein [Desulfatibacillaceae bacterium]|nr:DUF6475 domain-containing protein [Desulfatibacillaceae bacterium]